MLSLRRAIVCAALVASVMALAATAAPAATRAGRCATPAQRFALGHRVSHLRTVLKTRRVWILHTNKSFGDEYFACWRPTGLARRIGFTSGGAALTDTSLESFVLNGRFVAFHIRAAGDEHYDRFRSFDVRALRFARDTGKVPATQDATPTAVVVTSRGALAWLASATLHATDAGATRVIVAPSGGPISDFAARGRTVFWTQSGVRRSAALD
ncbi:MAG: hypothetical protein QOE11_3505 [Solirubrobacteraceae bacterium]|jgi:hypothetical protein|nr:hypothetical protein [Solirubrobacteraceae bacterium]